MTKSHSKSRGRQASPGFFVPITTRSLVPSIALSLILIVVMLLPSAWQQALTLYPNALFDAPWQLLTGHLVHMDWSHLGLNIGGLWLWWLLYIEHFARYPKRWLWLLPIALCSSVSQLTLDAASLYYVGFSGTLYGLFAAGIVLDLAPSETKLKRVTSALIGIALIALLISDWHNQVMAMGIALAAHLGGVVGGMTLALISLTQQFRRRVSGNSGST